MIFKIQLFATLKAHTGLSWVNVELSESATVADLLKCLAEDFPSIGPLLKSTLVAVNHEFAAADLPLSPSDEIALFPAVSGGLALD